MSTAASGSRPKVPAITGACSSPAESMINFDPKATSEGITAPAATSPLILFSTVSAISSGFFMPGGTMAAIVSLKAHTPTSSSAGSQNVACANHGSCAFSSGVSAFAHW